jgi:cell division protein FtsB
MNREKGKSQAELAQLNNEVRSLEKSVAELEQQTETLASMNRRIPI